MDVSLFDFDLPEERIALRPASPRDSARMLVVRQDGQMEHRRVSDLAEILRCGDLMVFNNTKVIPARLRGRRLPRDGANSSAKIELMLHKRIGPDRFLAFARPARRLVSGDSLLLGAALQALVTDRRDGGEVEVRFGCAGEDLDAVIAREGEIPLPPYIAGKRKPDARDASDYQTMFAEIEGSVAAPTAGLHFTPELMTRLRKAGVSHLSITLHVGAGTFLPVSADDTDKHLMHSEFVTIGKTTARTLNARSHQRLVAVGTTALRALESAADSSSNIRPLVQETNIFITPGYQFRTANVLLTNFHLPRSTLFMLVCAFCGIETMKRAYAEAIREHYRFYSYGDACLLFR